MLDIASQHGLSPDMDISYYRGRCRAIAAMCEEGSWRSRVYIKDLELSDFRAFHHADVKLPDPNKRRSQVGDYPNVSVFLGDNGGGKSSVLRAVAIICLAPILSHSGFVPYRLVRRPSAQQARIAASVSLEPSERGPRLIHTVIHRPPKGDQDRIEPPFNSSDLFDDDRSPAFFLVGYGATRRVETGDYSESSSRKSRGPRYTRVASLFEDQVALVPFSKRLSHRRSRRRMGEMLDLLNACLPESVRCVGLNEDADEEELLFKADGEDTPLPALSDGFRAFVGLVGDLVGRLAELETDEPLDQIPGIVLIDEIDLHLHPSWQRVVVPTLARTFPRLQFLVTSHSPLVAGSVSARSIFVVERNQDGVSTIEQLEERTFGRSAEELLLSSYFGLPTTRSVDFEAQSENLFARAADGDAEAALTYLRSLTDRDRRVR